MKKRIIVLAAALALGLCGCFSGCTVVKANRSFPTVAWYWSKAARDERDERAAAKAYADQLEANNTNLFSPLPAGK